jgi:hypothetical protein
MDFEKLAQIFEEKARSIHAWAQCEAEYKIADALNELARDIRSEIAKTESDE